MGNAYEKLWIQLEGDRGWGRARDDLKELITNPLLWATNMIEYATENNSDSAGVTGMNEAAWQRVNVALDVLKWINETK